MRNLLQIIQTIKQKGFTEDVVSSYSKDELYVLRKILEEYEEFGRSETLEALWKNDFEERPVSIDEFLEDDYYLGRVGRNIYPVWRKDLRKVLSPLGNVGEWVISGSIGAGKTYVAAIANIYKIYYLLCFRNPQRFHGLADGSPIVFGLFNIYKYLAGATSYQYLTTWLRDMSPFFAAQRGDHLQPTKKISDKQVLKLPKNISIALGAAAIHALGQNIFGGLCDEAEFGKAKSMTSQEKSQVADLYHNVRTRMDSRFMQRGGTNPGLLCLVSSARDTEQFLAQHVQRKREDPFTHISNYALYDVKEDVYKDSPRFTVVVGDKLHRSYILDDEKNKVPRNDAKTIQVPEEFYEAFKFDIDTAIRDIAGVQTYGSTLFFPQRDRLLQSLESSTKREHPFSDEEVILSIDDDVCLEDYFHHNKILELWDKTNLLYRPRFYPHADRFVHVDLAKNRDCAGLAMSCISETVLVDRYNTSGMRVRARDYRHFLDFALRIRAAHGSEIDFAKIRQFLFFLIDTCKFKIRWVSYDSYQSTDSIQILKKEKIQAKELSLDRKPGPYRTFRSVLMEGRFDWYYYDPFFTEVSQLEDHTLEGGKKIDHPVGGCFTGDTRVPLLDGAEVSLVDLYDRGDPVWVYSVDLDRRRVFPALAHPIFAGEQSTCVVVLDNGEEIHSTLDHKFMLRDGTYKDAAHLSPGDSLMPLYRGETDRGYETIYNPFTDEYTPTHKLSDLYNLEHGYDFKELGGVRHHLNFDKRDNSPDNIQRLGWFEHMELHRSHSSSLMRQLWSREDFSSKVRESARALMKSHWSPAGLFRKVSRAGEYSSNYDFSVSKDLVLILAPIAYNWNDLSRLTGYSRDILSRVAREVSGSRKAFQDEFMLAYDRYYKVRQVLEERNTSESQRITSSYTMSRTNRKYAREYSRRRKRGRNHKVASVYLSSTEPVFCLEVPEYSNFALSSGVFVHNSKDVSDAICGSITGSLLTKGVQVTGTDADRILRRATEYAEASKAPAKIKSADWVKPDSTNVNPLDSLFD